MVFSNIRCLFLCSILIVGPVLAEIKNVNIERKMEEIPATLFAPGKVYIADENKLDCLRCDVVWRSTETKKFASGECQLRVLTTDNKWKYIEDVATKVVSECSGISGCTPISSMNQGTCDGSAEFGSKVQSKRLCERVCIKYPDQKAWEVKLAVDQLLDEKDCDNHLIEVKKEKNKTVDCTYKKTIHDGFYFDDFERLHELEISRVMKKGTCSCPEFKKILTNEMCKSAILGNLNNSKTSATLCEVTNHLSGKIDLFLAKKAKDCTNYCKLPNKDQVVHDGTGLNFCDSKENKELTGNKFVMAQVKKKKKTTKVAHLCLRKNSVQNIELKIVEDGENGGCSTDNFCMRPVDNTPPKGGANGRDVPK